MPTPQQIKAEFDSDPLGLGYAGLVGQDNALANLISVQNRDGYVVGSNLRIALLGIGVLPALELIRLHRLLPPSDQMTTPIDAAPWAVINLSFRLKDVIDANLRAAVADVAAGCDLLVALGLMAPNDKTAVLSFETKISRAQELWGLNARVSADDVALAYGRG